MRCNEFVQRSQEHSASDNIGIARVSPQEANRVCVFFDLNPADFEVELFSLYVCSGHTSDPRSVGGGQRNQVANLEDIILVVLQFSGMIEGRLSSSLKRTSKCLMTNSSVSISAVDMLLLKPTRECSTPGS